jgi:hypothetical protein
MGGLQFAAAAFSDSTDLGTSRIFRWGRCHSYTRTSHRRAEYVKAQEMCGPLLSSYEPAAHRVNIKGGSGKGVGNFEEGNSVVVSAPPLCFSSFPPFLLNKFVLQVAISVDNF